MSWVGSEAGCEGFQAACEAVRGPGLAIAGTQTAVLGGKRVVREAEPNASAVEKEKVGNQGKTTACVRNVSRALRLYIGLTPSASPYPPTHTQSIETLHSNRGANVCFLRSVKQFAECTTVQSLLNKQEYAST